MFPFSESQASNQESTTPPTLFLSSTEHGVQIFFNILCIILHGTVSAGYFSHKFQGPFPMTRFAQIRQLNIGTQCWKTAWWSRRQGSKCHKEMDTTTK